MNSGNTPTGPSGLSLVSDSILVARAIDGDIAAFEVITRRYGPLMRVYAARLLDSDVESDDVVQEAFIVAWRKMSDVADGRSVKTWLMRIVTNKTIDRIRVRKQHLDITDWDAPTPSNESPAHTVEVRLQMDALGVALHQLPDTQRKSWMMKEIGGSSYAEIAEQLDLPISTVRGQLARARQTLMHEMEAWR